MRLILGKSEIVKRSALRSILLVTAAASFVAVAGCDRSPQVRAYTTPKETAQPAADESMAGMDMAQAPAAENIQWTLPAGWKELDAGGDPNAFFRPDARISVDPSDPKLVLTISHLGDAPGARSVLGNVNRWEGQEGLPLSNESDLARVTSPIASGGDRVDLTGKGTRLLGAIIPHARQTWFVKLVGPEKEIAAKASEFDAFLASIHFSAAAAPSAPSTASNAAPPGIEWKVPSDWTAEGGNGPLLARFETAGGAIEIKVSTFATGNFGSLTDNLNRWHGEVGLPDVTAAEARDVAPTILGQRAWTIYDFSSPASAGANAKRVIVGQTEEQGQTYFFKMLGPANAVAQQKPSFEKFLASVELGK